ncbi:MAG: SHOCT domain-containing protein [Candidatus Krumholzibacteriia bacterium]
MGTMWIWWLLAIGIIAAVVWGVTRTGGGRNARRESPEETLKRRYASGEIDEEEYHRRLADLRQ